MNEPWRKLKVGDKIRITRIPSFFSDPEISVPDPDDLLRLYEHLIECRAILAISVVDEHGLPWIDYEWIADSEERVSHSLAVNDDSWDYILAD